MHDFVEVSVWLTTDSREAEISQIVCRGLNLPG